MIRRRLGPRVSFVLLILLSCSTVLITAAFVTLGSIEIFQTHEWFLSKPTVYFQCKGEGMIILPDVKEVNISYAFKGEESWQPLTEFQENKCKRCGFYEKDTINSDEFDEWELCPSDFTSNGNYIHSKDGEFTATFVCPDCVSIEKGPHHSSSASNPDSKSGSNQLHWAIIAAITIVVSAVFIAGIVSICKYCQKRKRQQQQARFLKLFEDTDDVEDELGIGPLSNAY